MIEESKETAAAAGPGTPTRSASEDCEHQSMARNRSPPSRSCRNALTTISPRSIYESPALLAAEEIPKAKKLLKLTLSLGGDNRRTVFAGIKSAYKPESLVGRLVICVANLAPRQMQFGVSEGMVVAAGAGGEEIYLAQPRQRREAGAAGTLNALDSRLSLLKGDDWNSNRNQCDENCPLRTDAGQAG